MTLALLLAVEVAATLCVLGTSVAFAGQRADRRAARARRYLVVALTATGRCMRPPARALRTEVLALLPVLDVAITRRALKAPACARLVDAARSDLGARSWQRRVDAIRLLAAFGGDDVEALLIPRLRDRNATVRRAAVAGLGRCGSQRCALPMIYAASGRRRLPVDEVIEAVRRIGGPAVRPVTLATRDPDSIVRGVAVAALAAIGGPDAAASLRAVAELDRSTLVRRAASDAIARLPPPHPVAARSRVAPGDDLDPDRAPAPVAV
jgi:HEAT repeat protein